MQIIKGKQPGPRRILLYGRHGLGKSTWASQAPRPLFVNLEDGIADIDCEQTAHLTTFAEVMDCLVWISENDNPYKTVVIDTADWLERRIAERVCESKDVKALAEIDYGKGYEVAVEKWQTVLRWLDQIRAKGKSIILLAHSQVVKHSPPGSETYDRYEPAIDKRSSRLIQEWCDEVLFATTRVLTRKEDAGFGKKRNIVLENDERIVLTTDTSAAAAKNRLGLPPELPLDFAAYAAHIKTNINGVVVEGSSKKKEALKEGTNA